MKVKINLVVALLIGVLYISAVGCSFMETQVRLINKDNLIVPSPMLLEVR